MGERVKFSYYFRRGDRITGSNLRSLTVENLAIKIFIETETDVTHCEIQELDNWVIIIRTPRPLTYQEQDRIEEIRPLGLKFRYRLTASAIFGVGG